MKLNPNRPMGITVMGLYFLAYGIFFIIFRTLLLYGKGDPESVLELLNLSYFDFFVRFFLPPAVMLIAAYGLWYRKYWGWWLGAILMASTAIAFLIIFIELPFHDFLKYLLNERNGLVINLIVLAYLFLPETFKNYHGENTKLKNVIFIVVIISVLVGSHFADLRLDTASKLFK